MLMLQVQGTLFKNHPLAQWFANLQTFHQQNPFSDVKHFIKDEYLKCLKEKPSEL